jgi:hypothetical protein
MRKILVTVILSFTAAGLLANPEHSRKVQAGQWTGWIVDSTCGSRNANTQGKGCVLSCAKKGASLLLFTEANRPLFGLDDQKTAAQHVGERVRVTGDQDGAYIKIKKIEPAPEAPAQGK